MIRTSKNKNMPKNNEKPDFDDVMNEVWEEIQERDAEDVVVSRAPELRRLSENIDKATNTWINATLQLESAIRKYNAAQTILNNAVGTINSKVDSINTHIDNVLKDAPTKLKVSVHASDEDMAAIREMFDKEHKWMLSQMQKHLRDVNGMIAEERKDARKRFKEYDGCYLGHYSQWFFWFFFVLGFFVFCTVIVMLFGRQNHWF